MAVGVGSAVVTADPASGAAASGAGRNFRSSLAATGSFCSSVEGYVLSLDEEIAKLRLVVQTAREVWG